MTRVSTYSRLVLILVLVAVGGVVSFFFNAKGFAGYVLCVVVFNYLLQNRPFRTFSTRLKHYLRHS